MEELVLKRKVNIFYLKLGISREVMGSQQVLWSLEAADVLTKTREQREKESHRKPDIQQRVARGSPGWQQQPGAIQQFGRRRGLLGKMELNDSLTRLST